MAVFNGRSVPRSFSVLLPITTHHVLTYNFAGILYAIRIVFPVTVTVTGRGVVVVPVGLVVTRLLPGSALE